MQKIVKFNMKQSLLTGPRTTRVCCFLRANRLWKNCDYGRNTPYQSSFIKLDCTCSARCSSSSSLSKPVLASR